MKVKWVVFLAVMGVLGLAGVCQAQQDGYEPVFAAGSGYSGPEVAFGCCPGPLWTAYGEFLLLRPSNAKVSYAVPINGAIVPPAGVAPVQVGRESVLDIGYNSGFRVGFERALNECSSIGAVYTHFESGTSDSVALAEPPPDRVLRSLLLHPGTGDAATDFDLGAAGSHAIDFRMADIEYRHLLRCGPKHAITGLVGIRYGHLEQRLASEFLSSQVEQFVTSDIDFHGGGVRLGLEAETYAAHGGFFGYGKTHASFLAGRFSSFYSQADRFREQVVEAGWKEDRVVPILDLEVGLGWVSSGGRVRVTGGYHYAAWLNTLTTDEFIQAVQHNDSVSVRETLVFDGLVFRTEIGF